MDEQHKGKQVGRAAATGLGLAAAAVGGVAIAGAGLAGRTAVRRSRAYAVTGRDRVHVFPFVADKVVAVPANDGVVLHAEIDEPDGWAATVGPTVVLVHGFVLNLSSWVHQRRALVEAGYRVVSYDQRNHGVSESGDLAHCTIDQLGKDLRAVIDATTPDGDIVLVELDVRESLPGLVETPMLIVAGSKDVLTPPQHSERLAEALPAAEFIVIPGVGHLLQLERPGPVTDAVLALLDRPRGVDAEKDAERAKAAVRGQSA